MNSYAIIFTNNYGKFAKVVVAESQELAINKAVEEATAEKIWYYIIEAVLIKPEYIKM